MRDYDGDDDDDSWFFRKRRSVDSQVGGNLAERFCSNSSSTLCKVRMVQMVMTMVSMV